MKFVNFLDKIATASEAEIQHLMTLVQNVTPKAVHLLNIGYNVMQTLIKDVQSPSGVGVEALIGSALPQTIPYMAEIVPLAEKAATAMRAVSNDLPAVEGIALRYGAEIMFAIDGAKKTIDEYIGDLQNSFIPAPIPVA